MLLIKVWKWIDPFPKYSMPSGPLTLEALSEKKSDTFLRYYAIDALFMHTISLIFAES